MSDEQMEQDRMTAEGAPANDEKSVFDNAAVAAPKAVEPKTAKPTSKQIRSLVDVVTANVRRSIKSTLNPKTVEAFSRVAERAVKLQIEGMNHLADARANSLPAGYDARRQQIESQLKAIKSISSSLTSKAFWKLVNDTIDHLSAFTVKAVVAAL